jgi:hypothetical protein
MLSQVEALTGIVEENAYPQLGQRVVVATPNEIVFWPEDNQRATLRVGKKALRINGGQRQETYARIEGYKTITLPYYYRLYRYLMPPGLLCAREPPGFALKSLFSVFAWPT